MNESKSEKIAREAYMELRPRDKTFVDAWRDLGCSWLDSVLNSGVLSSGPRFRPGWEFEQHRAEQDARDQFHAQRQAAQRREAAEHEAAHVAMCQSLGYGVTLAYIRPGGNGWCHYLRKAKSDPFGAACIAIAGQAWIEGFRTRQFPRGAQGCEDDLQKVKELCLSRCGVLIDDVKRYAFGTLRDNQHEVLRIADKIETDGHYMSW